MKTKIIIFIAKNGKKIGKLILPIFVTIIAIFLLIFANGGEDESIQLTDDVSNVSPNVLKWRKEVEKATKKWGIPGEVNLVLAIMMVETGGNSPDIMQSSESKGLPMNSITNEVESIDAGVEHLANTIKLAEKMKVKDVWTAVAAYNFGSNYVNFIASRGGKHTTELAEKYSRDVVAPSLGNTTGQTYSYPNPVAIPYNGGFLYLNGGNFFYTDLVKQYLTLSSGPTDEKGAMFSLPINNPVISSPFGYRTDPFSGQPDLHRGLDFANPYGTPIRAIGDGKVVTQEMHYSWGNVTVVEHPNGYMSLYAHQSAAEVKVGDTVKKGQVIGQIGSTGDSTGPHLHLEISKTKSLAAENLIDPKTVLGIK